MEVVGWWSKTDTPLLQCLQGHRNGFSMVDAHRLDLGRRSSHLRVKR